MRGPQRHVNVVTQCRRGLLPLPVGGGDDPRPRRLQLPQPGLLLLLQTEMGHRQPNGRRDRRGRGRVIQRGRPVRHGGDRPARIADGEPSPVPARYNPLAASVHVGAVAIVPSVDLEVPVAQRVTQHHGEPIQAGESLVGEQPVGQPRPGAHHGPDGQREGHRDQQQHELVAEQGQGRVERARSADAWPPMRLRAPRRPRPRRQPDTRRPPDPGETSRAPPRRSRRTAQPHQAAAATEAQPGRRGPRAARTAEPRTRPDGNRTRATASTS